LPSTEADLGDGIFPLVGYRGASGRWGIGGDSHVSRDPAEELRLLEYVQRLVGRGATSASARPPPPSARRSGSKRRRAARRRSAARWARSRPASAPISWCSTASIRTSRRVRAMRSRTPHFSGSQDLVRDVMVAGRWLVRERQHAQQNAAAKHYARAVAGIDPGMTDVPAKMPPPALPAERAKTSH